MDSTFSSFQEKFRGGIHRYAGESGIDVVFFGISSLNMAASDDRARASLLDLILPSEFDGILSVSTTLTYYGGGPFLAERLTALRPMPFVSIGTPVIGEPSLVIDNDSGMRAVMRHLLEYHGYRSFAFVSGPQGNIESRERLQVFREALAEAGIAQGSEWEYEGTFLLSSGYSAVQEILDVRGLMPDVFVCANDLMALGAYNALSARGLRIPFDVAVTGYDDIQFEQTISHGITTVHQAFSRLSYLAMKRLHMLATGSPVAGDVMIDPDVRIRASCGCLDFRARHRFSGKPAEQTAELSRLSALATGVLSGSSRAELERAWIDLIHDGFASHRATHEFEELLHTVRDALPVPDDPIARDALIQDLYAILCEECSQHAFIASRNDQFLTRRLQGLVDRLHDEISRDITLSGHDDVLREIAALLGLRRLYIVRFSDFGKTGSDPKLVFAGGSELRDSAGDAWKPGPDSWFPPNAGNLVINLIHYDEDRFGYFLLDSDIPAFSVYEYLRFRFGFISMNLKNLDRIKRLNAELTSEIAIRVGTEQKLKDVLALVERLSIQDDLTGLYNRRGFFMFAEQNIKYFFRQKSSFFVLYADLDGLKQINDQWGHTEGDFALRQAAAALQETIRDSDIVARLGGDEFTILISKANPPDFDVIRTRIRDAFERKNREIRKPWVLSLSIGHYHATSDCSLTLEEMLQRADEDLYREKARKKDSD